MYTPQEACGVVFNVKLSFHVVGFALWLLRSALRLQPSELITDAFPFGWRMPFFFGWPALFLTVRSHSARSRLYCSTTASALWYVVMNARTSG